MHTIVGPKLDLCNIFPFCISCSWPSDIVHDMYVHGIYMNWTCMYTNIHTNICMFMYVHCLNIVWMKYVHSLLYIRVCSWYIHGIDSAVHTIYMSVHISSLFIKNMENHSVLSVLPWCIQFRTRLYSPCNMYVLCYRTGIWLSVCTEFRHAYTS